MSIIFTEQELDLIEDKLGFTFTETFIKVWDERNGVKNYKRTVILKQKETKGYYKQYWDYKLDEVNGVIENQTTFINLLMDTVIMKLPYGLYKKFKEYVTKNEEGEK